MLVFFSKIENVEDWHYDKLDCVYIFLSVFSPYSSSVRKYEGKYSKKSGSETNRDTREGIEKEITIGYWRINEN